MYKKNAKSTQKRMALAAAGILTSIGFVLMPGAVQAADLNLDTQQKADNISAEWNPEIDNTTGMKYVYHNSSISDNTITIGNVKLDNYNIYGAAAGSRTNADVKSNAVNNTIIVSNTEIAGSIRGALADKGNNAENNKVIFNDSTLNRINGKFGEIYGAAVSDRGSAKNNQVVINSNLGSDSDKATIYGAAVVNGNAEENIVTINKGEVKGNIYGATSGGTGNLINNTVELNGGTITGNVYGAYGGNTTGEVKNNKIVLRDKANLENASLYGGRGANNAVVTDNELVIDHWSGKVNNINKVNSITFQNIVLGLDTPILAKSSNGKLVLTDSKYKLESIGAYDQDGNAIDLKKGKTSNIKFFGDNVKFDENKFSDDSLKNLQKDVIAETDTGVRVHGFDVEKDTTGGKDTMNELVATVNKSILTGVYTNDEGTYGEKNDKTLTIGKDFSTNADVISASYGTGDKAATGGTILIASDAGSTISYDLLGGKSDNGKVPDNTLSIDGWRGTVNSINAFDNYKFSNVALNQKDAVLSFTDTANTNIDAKNSNFEVVSLAQGQKINKGDSTVLIAGKDLSSVDKSQQIAYGTALDITGQIKGRQDGIDLKINDVMASAQTKSINEGRVSALGFLNQGGDLISKGIASINERGKYGVETFAAMQGDDISFDKGVDINGWHGIVGVGNNVKSDAGDFAWGVFAEKGDGSFDTNSTVNGNFVSGDGSVNYNGGGLAARLTKDSGMYTEALFRAGKIKHEVDHGLQDELGNLFDYRMDSSYYGFGLGAGKIFSFDNGNTMDAYLKYFHSNIGSDSFTLSNGEIYDMDDINSDRIRLGARYNQSFGKNSLYYGAAWEYEFSGDSDGTAQGYAIDTASLGGSTFIGEIGFNFAPTEDSPWDFDLGVKGFAGEREGFIGDMQATYHF